MRNIMMSELSQFLTPSQIRTDFDTTNKYGRDWTKFFQIHAQAILFPSSTEHVQKIVTWGRKHRASLVPSGGRTGLSGGAVASRGEFVVSFELMNDIGELNDVDMTISCQAGVVTEALQKYVADRGFFFPIDFASRGSSQIGGNIATNAGGIKVVRYGLTRDWVSGLTVVTGAGDVLHLNHGLIKNASGYDFRNLFIGSEGTLGFITEALLRITHPEPETSVLVLGTSSLENVMSVFSKVRKGLPITAFEMFSEAAMTYVLKQHPQLKRPFETQCPFYVLVEFENTQEIIFNKALEIFEKSLEENLVTQGVLSQSHLQAREFWKLREFISESLSPHTPYKNDISVRISKVPEFVTRASEILGREYPNFEVIWFGHIGDGNLHINILKPKDLASVDFLSNCQKVDRILFQLIHEMNGSISAEHGVGLIKKNFLSNSRSLEEIELMRGVKRVFDPDGIINPGKIF